MADPFAPNDGRVDVTEVMAALRDKIRRRTDAASLEEAVGRKLRELADSDRLDPQLLEIFLAGHGRWNVSPDYPIVSHRSGLAARVVGVVKRLIHPVVRLYTDPIVVQQALINQYHRHVIETLIEEMIRLRRAQTHGDSRGSDIGRAP
jgi:hypothetical protein